MIKLIVRVNIFTYPRQFSPCTALYNAAKVRTVPTVAVSEIPALERAHANVCVLTPLVLLPESSHTPWTNIELLTVAVKIKRPASLSSEYGFNFVATQYEYHQPKRL